MSVENSVKGLRIRDRILARREEIKKSLAQLPINNKKQNQGGKSNLGGRGRDDGWFNQWKTPIGVTGLNKACLAEWLIYCAW